MTCYFFVSEQFVATVVANTENKARKSLIDEFRLQVVQDYTETDEELSEMFILVDSVPVNLPAGVRKFTDEV